MYVYMHACIYVKCMYECMYVCMCECLHVIYMNECLNVCTLLNSHKI